ncbi:YppF family protein [Thermaerobacillus caldiproteolyticus]|uniref:YppF family protein n=1 Tax=Thermaerobacillus caldiproteolyticus TaxID=247480 RepID=UPI0018F1152A|nr:YppF family protein [Anoxybacillus caldiproteolyticus]
MNIAEFKHKFIASKNYKPTDMNELLDFARQVYLRGEITIAEYRDIARELEKAGACKPDFSNEYIEL